MPSQHTESFPSWLLAFGLVMSVATQLRLPSMPVGPGELLLAGWIIATLRQDRIWMSKAVLSALLTILFGGISLWAGSIVSDLAADTVTASAVHDATSYLFCALLAVNYVSLREKGASVLTEKLLVAFLASTVVALLLGWALRGWSGLDVLYGGLRWQHLSNNPNQFALMALPLPFVALHFIRENPQRATLTLVFLIGLLSLALGWASRSDALTAGWLVGGSIVGTALLLGRFRPQVPQHRLPESPKGKVRGVLYITVLAITMVIGSALQFLPVMADVGSATPLTLEAPATSKCDEMMPDGNQVNVRYALWHNALSAISRSPVVGLGPGAHSGICGPFNGKEAHNTLLDWGTQAGVLGLIILLAYGGSIFYHVARQGDVVLVGMLISLGIFSMFHFTLRQPIFWIIPLLALDLARLPQSRHCHRCGSSALDIDQDSPSPGSPLGKC